MSKKMKGVALDSSRYVSYEDVKARFKHQSLMQDFQELEKETEETKNKLEVMKQRKVTLMAEVRFLRQRHKYLLETKVAKPSQGQKLFQRPSFYTQLKNTMKENISSWKETKPQTIAPILDVSLKEMKSNAKKCARKTKECRINHKEKKISGKEASLGNTTPGFHLNQKDRKYGAKEVTFKHPSPVLHLNQKERLYVGKETNSQNRTSGFDLNLVERPYAVREDAVQNRAPVFDLNQISGEELELQDNYEALRTEEPKKIYCGGSEEQLNELKLSICRNVGNGPNRSGKRKISWQDPVALKV